MTPCTPFASNANPPKSHKFPAVSVQVVAALRAPGVFAGEATPRVPYIPLWFTVLLPAIQVHSPMPQSTTIFATLAVVAVPVPFSTVQDCEGLEGCERME